MAFLGTTLFIARSRGDQRIEMYNSLTIRKLCQLVILGLSEIELCGHAMASCEFNNCLYVGDGVHFIQLQ